MEILPPTKSVPDKDESHESLDAIPAKGHALSKRTRKTTVNRTGGWLNHLKQWSWRLTAVWCWLHLLMHFFFGSDKLIKIENITLLEFERWLSFFGFSPTNQNIFPLLVKIVWLSLICGFSIIQVTWFFLVYLPTFPLLFLFLCIFRNWWKENLKKNYPKPGLIHINRSYRNNKNAAIALFTAWLILYGGSDYWFPQLVGISLAGIFLIQRIIAALSFAGPIEEIKSKWAEMAIQIANNRIKVEKNDLIEKYERFLYRVLLRLTWFTRGSKGRTRAAMFVLTRYLTNLLVLGFATILFWALIIRLTSHPHFIGLGQAILVSSTRVLPGINIRTTTWLPTWVEAGSSASAWILFVLYAGPAASIFPLIQQAYVNAMSNAHIKFRHAAVELLKHIRKNH